jgi:hypothetical protein
MGIILGVAGSAVAVITVIIAVIFNVRRNVALNPNLLKYQLKIGLGI